MAGRRTVQLDASQLVPGGILETDHWHLETNDGTCSRCREPVGEEEVPLLLWSKDGHNLLIYCASCTECGA